LFSKKTILFLIIVLTLGLSVTGCDLFNDINLDNDEILEDQSKADFFNTVINDFGDVLQSFIDATYYEEPEITALEEPFEHLVFPQAEDLDFADFFSHYDLFIAGEGKIVSEEEAAEDLAEIFQDFLKGLLWDEEINQEDFNDTVILIDFHFNYFFEIPFFYRLDFDYPQEGLKFFQIIVTRTITIEEEEKQEFREAWISLAQYEEEFRIIDLNFWNLIGGYNNVVPF